MPKINRYGKGVPDAMYFNINTSSPGGACSCDRTVFSLNSLPDRQVMVVLTPGGVAYGFQLEQSDHSVLEEESAGY